MERIKVVKEGKGGIRDCGRLKGRDPAGDPDTPYQVQTPNQPPQSLGLT